MKCRMFALSLALGALLCLAPSAAALEPQPEAPAPDTAAASQTDTPAAPAEEAAPDAAEPAGQALTEEVTQEVTVTVEVPILPEKPPIQISYTTPEEIGFAWEEDGIQGIRVTGAEDVLHGLACLLGQGSHAAHQGGFPTAGAALQDVDGGGLLRRKKLVVERIESCGGVCPQKILYRIDR